MAKKPTKPKTMEVKTKKSDNIEKGENTIAKSAGCEIVCIKPSETAVVWRMS